MISTFRAGPTVQPAQRLSSLEQRLKCSTAERPRGACQAARMVSAAAAAELGTDQDEEEDLKQFKDRDEWYIARFAANDAPDFNPGTFLASKDAALDLRTVSVAAEISRESVPLRNAYMHVGQKCSIRVNNGPIRELTVSSPPFPLSLNQDALFKARGDISAGEIKIFKDIVSVEGQVDMLLSKKEAEEVFDLTEGDKVEIGPFVGAGLDLRPMQSIYQFPTIIVFAEGNGIATAKALLEATDDASGLNMGFRQQIRLYYRAPNEASLLFTDQFERWEANPGLKVFTGTRDTFTDLFDDDDTLTYEPETTAAIILTGGDEDAEKAALEACKEAEIQTICKDSTEQIPTKYLAQIHGQDFRVQLYTVPVVRRSQFLKGDTISAAPLHSARHHIAPPVQAVVAPPQKSKELPPFEAWNTGAAVKKRTDIKTILILGPGPIIIGQACEFDYSGTQACKALRAEGYRVVLINSNPATIMTDPGTADRTYIGPMTPELVEQIIEKERPDAVLPTMGGQTALNLAKALSELGILDKYGCELIGAKLPSINKAEDRELFKRAMKDIGLKTPPSGTAETWEQALEIHQQIGKFPLIIRPAFTLGGSGGGIAYNMEEYEEIVKGGLAASVTSQVLIEMSLLGWKEYELEVMRDLADNVVIICSIENIDPMGVHTGDSITTAPAQTLTDKEYQRLRDASVAIIREMGVECGGSNVQMAINPADGELMIIEMNPRVSRSSALASKATGFPIAKIAAKLAVGLSLDQIANDITLKTPASFEPSIDYVVTKIPRFAFEKFPGATPTLTTQMKSVGEAMAIGRTFQESFQKALRSLETGLSGWSLPKNWKRRTRQQIEYNLRVPNPERMSILKQAMEDGMTLNELFDCTNIDPWFLHQLKELHQAEQWLKSKSLGEISTDDFIQVKKRGFSDIQIATCTGSTAEDVRARRKELGVVPSMKRVDTCAAEFEAVTPYMYSSYDGDCECQPTNNKKVLILGGGPNRIGQGIEFDYCCCHASFALKAAGYETIMMNSNPETVSTDYDTSSRLYFEPLTVEDVLNVVDKERPDGIIVQFGGQTPLSLAGKLQEALKTNPIPTASGEGNVRIWGTQPENINEAEDRDLWYNVLTKLDIKQPPGTMVTSEKEALVASKELGYPVMVRPSFVLGGRAMEIVYSDKDLKRYIENAVEVDPERPVLVDKYLDRADELDVDALCDKDGNVVICGIMQHIEQAGVHSGDSACTIPPQSIPQECLDVIRDWTPKLAKELKVVGLINIQYCVQDGQVYIIEANPRASRTVPFVAKAIGHPVAKYASLLMSGQTLKDVGFTEEVKFQHVAVKEAVLPFDKFQGADTLLGPEMKSTGEVMGIDTDFSNAYAKAAIAAGLALPKSGKVFITMIDKFKEEIIPVAKQLKELGYGIIATKGTAAALKEGGVEAEVVLKIQEGRPNATDLMKNKEIAMMFITSTGDEPDVRDGKNLRRNALALKIPVITTVAGSKATTQALAGMARGPLTQVPLQDYFPEAAERSEVDYQIVG